MALITEMVIAPTQRISSFTMVDPFSVNGQRLWCAMDCVLCVLHLGLDRDSLAQRPYWNEAFALRCFLIQVRACDDLMELSPV